MAAQRRKVAKDAAPPAQEAAPRTEARSFGFSDAELATLPTVFRDDLCAGQVALVSGAGSGIGKAIAYLFARLGASVVLCGRDPTKLAQTEIGLRRLGAGVLSRSMSIRDPEQVSELMDATWAEYGRLDVLVNNAGGQFPAKALDFTVKGWNAVIDTNLNGTWYMMQQAALRWQERQQPGCIVNIVADIWRGLPDIAHTCAARAGVIYLSKTVAVEWAPLGIRVNCVAPGCVETSAFALYPPEGAETYYQSNPLLRAGDVQDVAEACVYLAAPSGKFVTGEVVTVDGGQQLWGDPWPLGRPERFRLG